MEYLGAREVRVPCTTAETHSAPKRAFQNGTDLRGQQVILSTLAQVLTARLDRAVVCDGLVVVKW
jgi:hypothetical protein